VFLAQQPGVARHVDPPFSVLGPPFTCASALQSSQSGIRPDPLQKKFNLPVERHVQNCIQKIGPCRCIRWDQASRHLHNRGTSVVIHLCTGTSVCSKTAGAPAMINQTRMTPKLCKKRELCHASIQQRATACALPSVPCLRSDW
jgi:hypothetical protein